ncbi:hypothetical protein [Sulfurimonas indica]|uniref:hypothetical protein n=1 Tax=Sulfurimonas TaxID=202746 RepID=UPI00126494B2|nr:hypothetical protein [Sulfurimonas indica]
MNYKEPMDICDVLNEKYIAGYCNMLTKKAIDIQKKHGPNGPIIFHKNQDYGFLMFDYGFLIYSLIEYVKGIKKASMKIEEGEDIAKLIERDFLRNDDEKLARNGKFFVNILSYHGLSFLSKSNKNFYNRILLKDKKSNKITLLNSVSINSEPLEKIIGKKAYEERISLILNSSDIEVIGYDRQVTSTLKAIEGTVEIHQFWSKSDGLNEGIFN